MLMQHHMGKGPEAHRQHEAEHVGRKYEGRRDLADEGVGGHRRVREVEQ